jgi:TPR repeat protein
LKRACQLDRGGGCFALGYAHLNGEGTPKDEAAARANFQIACEANEAEAGIIEAAISKSGSSVRCGSSTVWTLRARSISLQLKALTTTRRISPLC